MITQIEPSDVLRVGRDRGALLLDPAVALGRTYRVKAVWMTRNMPASRPRCRSLSR
jgi:hypothetical protein